MSSFTKNQAHFRLTIVRLLQPVVELSFIARFVLSHVEDLFQSESETKRVFWKPRMVSVYFRLEMSPDGAYTQLPLTPLADGASSRSQISKAARK